MKLRGFLTGLFLLPLCACKGPSTSDKLTVAVAANMQFAINEIVEAFTAKTNITCDLVVGSSGKLTAQITEGAPFDIFLSADLKYPRGLYQNKLTTTKPKVYAHGKLVLWSLDKNIKPSLDLLTRDRVQRIALANPKTAPYGRAAKQVLQYNGLYDSLMPKLVFGESIAQTNQFVGSGAAQLGFTAKSTLMAPVLQGKGIWIALDSTTYSPIQQGIVLLGTSEQENKEAQVFYDFIFSKEAGKILKKYGYSIDE